MARILQLSDTHLTAPGAPTEHPEIDAVKRLRQVVEVAPSWGPYDAVVVTGDVCDDGSVEGAGAVRALLAPLAPVVLAVAGNHDSTAAIQEVFGDARTHLGSWQVRGAHTNVPHQVHGDGRPLAAAIRASDGAAAIVLYHHPVHSRSTHEWFTLEHRDLVLSALQDRREPLVLLSGHTHEAFELQQGPVHFLGGPSTYYGLAHRGSEFTHAEGTTGARVIDLTDDGTVRTEVLRA